MSEEPKLNRRSQITSSNSAPSTRPARSRALAARHRPRCERPTGRPAGWPRPAAAPAAPRRRAGSRRRSAPGRLRPIIALAGKIVRSLHTAFRHTVLRNLRGFWIDVPNQPMREQSNRRVWIIHDQGQTLCLGWRAFESQPRVHVLPVLAKLLRNCSAFLKCWATDFHFCSSSRQRDQGAGRDYTSDGNNCFHISNSAVRSQSPICFRRYD